MNLIGLQMHDLLIRLAKHVVLHRVRDEIGLLIILRPYIWRNILDWILVLVVLVYIVIIALVLLVISSRSVICCVRGHPFNSLVVKESILILGLLIIIKFMWLMFFTTSIR
jgi:hypothetical protein